MNKDNNDQLLIVIKKLNDKIAELEKSKNGSNRPIENMLESEQNFKALVESARDAIIVIQNDVIKFANPHAKEIFSTSLKNIIGQSFIKFVHPNSLEMIKKRYSDWKNGEKVPNFFQVDLINATEKKRICEINSSTIVFDGQPSELVIIHDITERKLAVEKLNVTNKQLVAREQQLRAANQQLITDKEEIKESEYQLNESQKIAGLCTYLLDISTGIWKSSSILDNIFGLNKKYKKDLAGWLQIVHPEDKEIMQNYFAINVLKNHELFNKEYRIKRINDQQERWVHGMGKLKINDDGDPIKMSGTIQDITERKQAEEKLKNRNKELELFNEVTVDRELKMIELKKEINELLEKSGEKPKYKIPT